MGGVGDYKFPTSGEFRALEQGRLREIFGSGTACQICPVHQILYEGKPALPSEPSWTSFCPSMVNPLSEQETYHFLPDITLP
ncbi:Branched-chain-amino-acid aminotransferase, mitochondrial [Microtus ochrogaster]|uniref:Branched-chain-amino-acid aminotransferase, mitochondrial n=1 Tax=Microtus ochrogaster TaxID=79684 RepID=A0A8J6L344_MICOH|nr:Branched-chain-amino-acid aminotransferase, mitochondrial [Microtus ochrogaster]